MYEIPLSLSTTLPKEEALTSLGPKDMEQGNIVPSEGKKTQENFVNSLREPVYINLRENGVYFSKSPPQHRIIDTMSEGMHGNSIKCLEHEKQRGKHLLETSTHSQTLLVNSIEHAETS